MDFLLVRAAGGAGVEYGGGGDELAVGFPSTCLSRGRSLKLRRVSRIEAKLEFGFGIAIAEALTQPVRGRGGLLRLQIGILNLR
jgi:hypothetical protein